MLDIRVYTATNLVQLAALITVMKIYLQSIINNICTYLTKLSMNMQLVQIRITRHAR